VPHSLDIIREVEGDMDLLPTGDYIEPNILLSYKIDRNGVGDRERRRKDAGLR
jgi:hypothetical protein